MTEIVEAPVRGFCQWGNGQGVDIFLDQDEGIKYFYRGTENIPMGPTLRFKVKKGTGDYEGKKEIISFEVLSTNPDFSSLEKKDLGKKGVVLEANKQPLAQEPQGKKVMTMPLDEFHSLLRSNVIRDESRFRSLDAAVKAYDAMNIKEVSPEATADYVLRIAKEFEAFLK